MTYKFLKKFLSRVSFVGVSFIFVLSLSSCGYRSLAQNHALSSYSTISIPYVEGDKDGELTSILAQTVVSAGGFKYRTDDGDLVLRVKILDKKVEDVGYDRQYGPDGQLTRAMTPNERRLSLLVEVTVIDGCTQKVLLGPEKLSTSVKYDFDPEFSEDNLVSYSLAQYNFSESAERMAFVPLNQQIAQIVTNYLLNSW